jgi:hypothetical protein
MEAEKEIFAKSSSLRKSSVTYSVNFMTLQRLCKKLEPGNVGDKFVEFYPTFSTVYDKDNFRCPDMHEVDETAVTTV